MRPDSSPPSLEDVLNAFAVEPEHNRATLERYLRDYPQYTVELVDLSHEVLCVGPGEESLLSQADKDLIDAAWKKHSAAAHSVVADLFAALSVEKLKEIAQMLDVPRQVITAFREHKVIVESIPKRFLSRLAALMNTTADLLAASLSLPQKPRFAGSFKAEEKPETTAPVTFERILVDAGVPEKKRSALIADD